jgi:hypothetical protein
METTGKDFVEFWGWASEKGGMNKNTALSLATSARRVISIEENWETVDVSTINVDDLVLKFRNMRKKEFTPDSLQVYERRFKQALHLFLEYHRDPVNWKFNNQTSTTRKPKVSSRRISHSLKTEMERFTSQPLTPGSMVEYPYPLRENCIVRMKLPIDLKMAEIERLIAFLRTLVIDSSTSLE